MSKLAFACLSLLSLCQATMTRNSIIAKSFTRITNETTSPWPLGFLIAKPLGRSVSVKTCASIAVGAASEIPSGERKVVDAPDGSAIIVANVGGSFFAVNAKCPHLGLPMKRGAIASEGGEPIITCNFHKSKFSMKDGTCKVWSESVFGIPGSQGLANMIGGIGGAKNSPATVYPVSVDENGALTLEI